MAVVPHTLDIVVADMDAALAFYRALGLDVPIGAEGPQVQIETSGGATIGLVSEALVRETFPDWTPPTGSRVSIACRCGDAAEVDETHAHMTAAGYESRRAPWNAVWGQRYAMLGDPDGTRIDLFAELPAADNA
jgi:uncharacterized glyoxalase superfamily protein PhnB